MAQDYSRVDGTVKKYPSTFSSIEAFANRIEQDFTIDEEKVRAAYYWMANHIEYYYETLGTIQTGYPAIEIKDYKNEEEFHYKYKKAYASHVLNYKKGICAGYSRLFFYVCEAMQIKSKVIIGNARTIEDKTGIIPNDTNHAWNAVYFNNRWNLLDVTWSTGNRDDKPGFFDFKDTYFCIPPEKMILTHFPKDSKWQLLKQPKTKKEFYTKPLIFPYFLSLDISLDDHTKGKIRAKTNGFAIVRFKEIDTTKKYYYSYVRDKYSKPITFKKEADVYVAKIPFSGVKKDRLDISVDTNTIVRFRIIPTR